MSNFMSKERMARWQISIRDPAQCARIKKIMRDSPKLEMSVLEAVQIDNEERRKRK